MPLDSSSAKSPKRPNDAPPPLAEYTRRRDTHRQHAATLAVRDRQLSVTRLLVFLSIVVTAWLAWGPASIRAAYVLAPIAVFLGLLLYHERIVGAMTRAQRAALLYDAGLDRLVGHWQNAGERGERFLDPLHPYAGDLDLFGDGSLYQLLCRARTRAGQERLAAWLSAPASPSDVRSRQQAVAELRDQLDLREDLALLGDDVAAAEGRSTLAEWGMATTPGLPSSAPWLAAALALATVAALVGWGFGLSPAVFASLVLLEVGLAAWFHNRVEATLATVEKPAKELALLARLIARIEQADLASPSLRALKRQLDTVGSPASTDIRRLHRLIELADSRRNQMFAPIALLLLWGTQFAIAIERWRQRCGPSLGRWIDVIAEVEALSSLSWHAFEQSSNPFPEIVDGPPVFAGVALRHPLLAPDKAVANDVSLGGDTHLWIVSGSNMSGKSTLLRTVGCNIVLALAGATVNARSLRLTPLQIGASINVHDSLRDGTSRFYAEIKRLRQVMDLTTGTLPLLFVLDEILHGTNSHDRRLGAAAVIRSLVERGAIGFVTTHDLALARIAEEPNTLARNVHFEDRIEEGKILFDYRLRDGVVERSNAIALMRAIGLEV